MQNPPGPVVLLQQLQNLGIIKRIAPASHNSQEFRLGAKPLHRCVKLTCNLRRNLLSRPFPHGRRSRFFSGVPSVAAWLDGSAGPDLLKPASDDLLKAWPVSKLVNRTGNDEASGLIEPISITGPAL